LPCVSPSELAAGRLRLPPLSTAAPIAGAHAHQRQVPGPPPTLGAFDAATVAHISLDDYAIIPEISATARAVYAAGLAAGNNPHIFSKLGDCMTENPHFLVTFAEGQYDLGPYADLQTVLDQYSGVPARSGDWQLDRSPPWARPPPPAHRRAARCHLGQPQWCQGGGRRPPRVPRGPAQRGGDHGTNDGLHRRHL
jgi:hypothetical protein